MRSLQHCESIWELQAENRQLVFSSSREPSRIRTHQTYTVKSGDRSRSRSANGPLQTPRGRHRARESHLRREPADGPSARRTPPASLSSPNRRPSTSQAPDPEPAPCAAYRAVVRRTEDETAANALLLPPSTPAR